MKKISKRQAWFCGGAFAIMFVIVMALLWTPQVSYSADVNTFQATSVLDYDDVSTMNQCTMDENGNVEILGGDAFLMFVGLSDYGQMIKFNFKEPLVEDTLIELYIDKKWGFNEVQKMQYHYTKGETSVYFLLGDYSYTGLRIDIDIPYQFESLEIGEAEIVETNQTSTSLWFLWATVIGLLSAVLMYVADVKYQLIEMCCEKWQYFVTWIKRRWISIFIYGVISAVISVLFTGRPYLSLFDIYEFLIMTAFVFFIICAISCLWNYRKDLINNFEKVFVMLLLLVGMTMILLSPMIHLSWDTDVHYRLALDASYLGETKLTRADQVVVNTEPISVISADALTNFMKMGMFTLGHEDVIASYETNVSLAHIPSGIFIALGRLFSLPFFMTFMLGKVANILLYTAICYFALEKLKQGKLIFAIIALFPTNIFLATNYSYDYWVTAFSMLGMAYFIGEIQDREHEISIKNTLIMCGALGLACLPKKIYFPLLLVPFLMPKQKIKNKKTYYAICILALVLMVILFMQAAGGQTSGTGDLRGGSDVGPADQIAFIFGDIIGYAVLLLKFLFTEYLTLSNASSYITLCGHLGTGYGAGLVLILLFLTVLFDREIPYTKGNKSGWLSRIYVVLMFFGGCALVATSMYVAFTPVGHTTVLGCQGRYLIPWLYPMLSVLSMNTIKPVISRNVMYWAVTVGAFGVLFLNLGMVFLPTVINI